MLAILYDPAHAAGWDPYNPHELAHVCWVRSVLFRFCTAQPLATAGGELDDLDHDLSDLSEVWNVGRRTKRIRVLGTAGGC